MKITAIAPWFGAKRVLADRIVAELGPHKAYWEPMCGSLAVLLAKPEAAQEIVSDMHGGIVCLARVLADEIYSGQFYRHLEKTLACEQLFLDSVAFIKECKEPPWRGGSSDHFEGPCGVDANMVNYAYHFFIASWLGRNGVAGTQSYNQGFCVRFSSNGGIQGTRFAAAVDSIPDWHRRLREVTILRRSVFELLPRIEDATGTVIYLDPPYLEKGAKYIHDFEPCDHDRLAEELRRFKRTRVCVSYYDDPRLDEMYPGWTKIAFDVSKSLVNQGSRDRRDEIVKAPEVLLINGPSLVAEKGLF